MKIKLLALTLFLFLLGILEGCNSNSIPPIKHFLIWHSYPTGSVEETILASLVENAEKQHPEWEIEVASIPANIINQRYLDEVKAGGGPDLYLDRNDNLGVMVKKGVVADITDELGGRLNKFTQQGVMGMTVGDGIYGIPLHSMTDVLYFNKGLLPHPPRTTDEILAAVESGALMSFSPTAYHLFAWPGAFGGTLMDENGKCIADQGGWLEAANFLLAMRDAGAVFSQEYTASEDSFRYGQSAMWINGPWTLSKYKSDLGDKLGTALIPSGVSAATPLVGLEGFYINPNTKEMKTAVDLGLYLTSKEAQKIFMEYANFIPVRTDVTIVDPNIQTFVVAENSGVTRPQSQEFAQFWTPFDTMWQKILLEDIDSAAAITEACDAMNLTNQKQ
jgi:arabinogalactan oligomer / maltooligosaccharide transport system substrate-binding protein